MVKGACLLPSNNGGGWKCQTVSVILYISLMEGQFSLFHERNPGLTFGL